MMAGREQGHRSKSWSAIFMTTALLGYLLGGIGHMWSWQSS